MDRLIRRFDNKQDGDLMMCEARGIAWQRNMMYGRVPYDAGYFKKMENYDKDIERRVIQGRLDLVNRWAAKTRLIDIGAGTGAFVRAACEDKFKAVGFDVIPESITTLLRTGHYSNEIDGYRTVTMWDVIEHCQEPEAYFKRLGRETLLFVSLPIFNDLKDIKESKHYRPGEHLYYFTTSGFVDWMAMYGFRSLEYSDHENQAGRDGIGAFAFIKDLPDYHDHIAAYREMHATRHYGDSATEEYLELVAGVVKDFKPQTILDYGCGRSDLVAHFWLDGKRMISRYDPAIGKYKVMPKERFDLVLCLDVMEHIPMASIDRVLNEVKMRGNRALFAISTIPARAKLPDGRNAHVSMLTRTEWVRWVGSYFSSVKIFSSREHEVILLAEEPT